MSPEPQVRERLAVTVCAVCSRELFLWKPFLAQERCLQLKYIVNFIDEEGWKLPHYEVFSEANFQDCVSSRLPLCALFTLRIVFCCKVLYICPYLPYLHKWFVIWWDDKVTNLSLPDFCWWWHLMHWQEWVTFCRLFSLVLEIKGSRQRQLSQEQKNEKRGIWLLLLWDERPSEITWTCGLTEAHVMMKWTPSKCVSVTLLYLHKWCCISLRLWVWVSAYGLYISDMFTDCVCVHTMHKRAAQYFVSLGFWVQKKASQNFTSLVSCLLVYLCHQQWAAASLCSFLMTGVTLILPIWVRIPILNVKHKEVENG